MPEVLFINLDISFLVCHVVSRIVAPSISLANSLISADVLSAAHEGYKNTFIKASFNVSFNKNRLETETIFLREESIIKNQKGTIKKSGSVT